MITVPDTTESNDDSLNEENNNPDRKESFNEREWCWVGVALIFVVIALLIETVLSKKRF